MLSFGESHLRKFEINLRRGSAASDEAFLGVPPPDFR
jgi:hypothetical protein